MIEIAPPTRASRLAKFAMPLLLILGVATLAAAILLPPPGRGKSSPTDYAFPVPDFRFTERSGKTVAKSDLDGNVWVASFVFTRCTGPCPSVTRTVAQLQSDFDLANRPNLRLVTFTVDPGRDGPKELQTYAKTFRAHPDRWLFLTGTEADLHTLMADGFKLGVKHADVPNPPEGQEFDHSTMIAVVDKAGKIRGHFDGYRGPNDADGAKYAESYNRLKATVSALLAE